MSDDDNIIHLDPKKMVDRASGECMAIAEYCYSYSSKPALMAKLGEKERELIGEGRKMHLVLTLVQINVELDLIEEGDDEKYGAMLEEYGERYRVLQDEVREEKGLDKFGDKKAKVIKLKDDDDA